MSMPTAKRQKPITEAPALEVGAERFVMHSASIGRDFQVTVTRPAAAQFVPGQTFPALYALDNGLGVAGPMGRLLGMAGAMAPAIVVSVGYVSDQDGVHRSVDLSHNAATVGFSADFDPITFGAGGAAFARFLEDDVRPFVEGRYGADPARAAIFGHSLGGLFAANVLADDPGAFFAYVIGSPSIWIDPTVVTRVEKAIARAKQGRVFVGVGSHEDAFQIRGGEPHMLSGLLRLQAALQAQPRIASKAVVYPDEGHLSVYSRIIEDAFPFVFPPRRPLTTVEPKRSGRALARCAGVYTLPDGRKVTVTCTPGGLVRAQVEGLPQVGLIHVGGARFYAPTADLDVSFDAGGFTLTGGGGAAWRAARD
jgi:predicted alpha/beta superfamily hydrolase